jgi:uncharacterized protein (TIGR00369 family)
MASVSRWSELLDRLVAQRLAPGEQEPPHVHNLGLPYPSSWTPGRVTASWKVDPRFFHERGSLFGGFLAALSDHALAMVTMSVLEDGEVFNTSDLRTSFFRPVTEGELSIEATVLHRGRSMIQAEVVFTRAGKLVGKATATQVIANETR